MWWQGRVDGEVSEAGWGVGEEKKKRVDECRNLHI